MATPKGGEHDPLTSERRPLSFYRVTATTGLWETGSGEDPSWPDHVVFDPHSTYQLRVGVTVAPPPLKTHQLFLLHSNDLPEDLSEAHAIRWGRSRSWHTTTFQGIAPGITTASPGSYTYRREVDPDDTLSPLHFALYWGMARSAGEPRVGFGRAGLTFLGSDTASVIAGAVMVQFKQMLARLKAAGPLPPGFDERHFMAEAADFATGYGQMLAKEMPKVNYDLDSGGNWDNNLRQSYLASLTGLTKGKTCGEWQHLVYDWAQPRSYDYLQVLAMDTPQYRGGFGEHHLCWLVFKGPNTKDRLKPASLRTGFSLDPWKGVVRFRSWDFMKKGYPELEPGWTPHRPR